MDTWKQFNVPNKKNMLLNSLLSVIMTKSSAGIWSHFHHHAQRDVMMPEKKNIEANVKRAHGYNL